MARSRRKMSAKQIKHFGTKRQKAALKARRHAPARKRNPPKGGGRVISGYGSTVMNPRRKKRNPGNHKIVINPRRKRANTSHRRRTRKNPELVSFLLGNPAQKRRKPVAHSRRKKRATAHRSNAGTRRRRVTRVAHRRHSRRNPGGGGMTSPMNLLMGGAGGLAGFVGSAALPQMVLGTGNTGVAGYAATAAAGLGLAMLAHFFLPRKPMVAVGVGIGATMNLLRRIISDQTPFGSYLSNPGMGDYMVANWGPPRMNNGLFSAMAEAPGTPWGGAGSSGGMITSSGVGIQDMADIRSARPC